MKRIATPLCSFVLFFVLACNNAQQENKNSVDAAENKNEQRADSMKHGNRFEEDHKFMAEAASGGLMEVQLGQLAGQNAASADVKEFGQMMVTDHNRANATLKDLAAPKNIALPTTPGTEHQQHISELQAKKGAEFDKAYMSMMVEDHREDVEKFEAAAREAKDPTIRAFAAKQVPILQQHLKRAQTINDGLKQ